MNSDFTEYAKKTYVDVLLAKCVKVSSEYSKKLYVEAKDYSG